MATRILDGRRKGRLASLAEALLTPHGADRYLELIDPMLVRREIRGTVTEVTYQTQDTVTLRVRPNSRWPGFEAGQYVRVSVDVDGVRRTRCYSPACSVHDGTGELELTVKADPNGLVSAHLHRTVHVGMVLGLSRPEGTFTLPDPRPERIVLISGGSGITPVLAMLRTLVDEGFTGEIAFLHYANTHRDMLNRTDVAALASGHPNLRVAYACTHAERGGDLHGLFCRAHLDEVAPWWTAAATYLCGPRPLMNAVRELFATAGLSAQLRTEDFAPPAFDVDTADATGTVRFTHSGRHTRNSGTPLLDQAEDAGLAPEHGCRMGICFSCTQRKTTGRVRDVRTGEHNDEENTEIQLCVSVPEGDVDIAC